MRDAMVPSQDEATVLDALRVMRPRSAGWLMKLILAYGSPGSRVAAGAGVVPHVAPFALAISKAALPGRAVHRGE